MTKKDQILDIAETLFNLHGYTAVGVDFIRDEAKISKTSMYRHFGSKKNLIEAVLQRRHQRFEADLREKIRSESGVAAKLTALINWHFDWFCEEAFHGCMFMHAHAEFQEMDDDISSLATSHKLWLKALITEILSDGRDVGPETLEKQSEVVMIFVEGMIVRAEFGDIQPFKSSCHAAIHHLVEVC